MARLRRGWRGPALAAFVAFLAGLPGLLAVPPLDRDESRFAQATAQMLESRDFVVIRYQEEPRFKKPVGIHWLQAASVSLVSNPEDREIWAYRIPSLLGAMLAAAACAWGAAAFFGPLGGPARRRHAGDDLPALHRGADRQDRRGAMRDHDPGAGRAGPPLRRGPRRGRARPAGRQTRLAAVLARHLGGHARQGAGRARWSRP